MSVTTTPVHATPAHEMRPSTKARLAGILFLATIVGGVYASAFITDKLVVTGDAAATARNIVANPSMIRIAFTIFLIEMACQVATTALTYDLLMPVERSVARLAAAFGYVGSGIKTMARLFLYAPLFVLGGASSLSAFDDRQLESIAYLLLRLNAQGAGVALPFLGLGTMLTGWLIHRSTFLPRWLGIITAIGGAGWLAFLYPPLGSALFLPVALFALFGCALTIGWFVVRGVDEEKWYATLSASGSIWR